MIGECGKMVVVLGGGSDVEERVATDESIVLLAVFLVQPFMV